MRAGQCTGRDKQRVSVRRRRPHARLRRRAVPWSMGTTFLPAAATWRVQDLPRSVAFYERLGFRAREAGSGRAELVPAAATDPAPALLRLVADPVAPVSEGRGAYHLVKKAG